MISIDLVKNIEIKINLKCFIFCKQKLDKSSASVKNKQQIQNRVTDVLPTFEIQSSNKQKVGASSYLFTTPPPPPPSPPPYKKQTLWFAAIFLGGSTIYVIYKNLNGKGYGILDESTHLSKSKFTMRLINL